LLASAHPLVRTGLAVLLRQSFPGSVLSEAVSMEQVVQHLAQGPADLLLLDLALIAGDPVACLQRLRARFPECRVLVLTERDDRSADLRAAGATIVAATGDAADLISRIRHCLDRGPLPRPDLPHPSLPPLPSGLTARQTEVYQLLAEGCSTKTIARRLDLAVGTVKVHLAGIYRALGATGRLEAVVKARGLDAPPPEPAAPEPEALPLFNWQWDSNRSPAA
jgi:DNA-binding NarL/FixJ family response regulator